jgi:hypothetical protein
MCFPTPIRLLYRRVFLLRLAVGCFLLGLTPGLQAAPKGGWLPVTPEELKGAAPLLEPEAAAEVLFRKIEVDDRDLPEESVTREYVRYKVYKPEKAERLMKISRNETVSASGILSESDVKLEARLILPDGTTKLFGREAIKERTLSESAAEKTLLNRLFGAPSLTTKEKFLAIPGIEVGAVLEYVIETKRTGPVRPLVVQVLQLFDFPTRRVEFSTLKGRDNTYGFRCFVLNRRIGGAVMETHDKGRVVVVTATNLPSITREPLMGNPSDYALVLMNCYHRMDRMTLNRTSANLDFTTDSGKTGPWSPIATIAYVAEADCAVATPRVKKLAAEITSTAKTPAERAAAIHRYAQERAAEFRKLPARKFTMENFVANRIKSLDDLLDYSKKPDLVGAGSTDFLWLALALYREAGLEARSLLLPDCQFVPFARQFVSEVLLPHPAVQVKIDGQWVFSVPQEASLQPLGEIPWFSKGQQALLAQPPKLEQFIETPSAAPTDAMIANGGDFTLASDGTLSGTGKRRYIGHSAQVVRLTLSRQKDPKAPQRYFAKLLNADFKRTATEDALEPTVSPAAKAPADGDPVETGPVSITKIRGLDAAGDIDVEYTLTLPGYAFAAGDRLVLRPSLFRLNFKSPFISATRTTAIRFPYAWQELDDLSLKLPEGYAPDHAESPPSLPTSALLYRTKLTYNAESRTLRLRREFSCQGIIFPVASYLGVKTFYDEMALGDQYELALVKTAAAPAVAL